MTTLIINGKKKKFKGDITINISNTESTSIVKEQEPKESYRTVHKRLIYDRATGITSEYYRAKDFIRDVGYPDPKAAWNKVLSAKGIQGRYADITDIKAGPVQVPKSFLKEQDNLVSPIVSYGLEYR